jgi:hypothetical protein
LFLLIVAARQALRLYGIGRSTSFKVLPSEPALRAPVRQNDVNNGCTHPMWDSSYWPCEGSCHVRNRGVKSSCLSGDTLATRMSVTKRLGLLEPILLAQSGQ